MIKLNVISSVLIIIILVGFIYSYNVLGIKTVLTEGANKINDLSSNNQKVVECPNNVIPSEIDLAEYEGGLWSSQTDGLGNLYYYWHPNWLDGQEMTLYPPTPEGNVGGYSRKYCKKGNEEGQNINYYYCNVGYSKTTTNISENGKIGKTETQSYLIKLTLEKKEHLRNTNGISLDRYSVISSNCSQY